MVLVKNYLGCRADCNFILLIKTLIFIALATMLGACGESVTLEEDTSTYTIAGTVTGLTGSGLVLRNNGGDDLSITADGSFVFNKAIADGSNYLVNVATQPTAPNQSCNVSLSSGTVTGADVSNVVVNCTANTYTVSGYAAGIVGSGLVLQNNAGDDLAITADGSFIFSATVNDSLTYAVSVLTPPSLPNQNCTLTNASGTISGANVTDVYLVCVTGTYTVGGSISGLAGTGLILENNGGDDLIINANGLFTFSSPLSDGSAYSVTVQVQPGSPSQTCAITNASGNLAGSNITNITVACVINDYAIGGTVTGLNGTGLVLQNNAGDNLAVAADGSFIFATPIPDGSAYAVSVLTQPTGLNQTCSVTAGSGTLSGSAITNVAVSCINDTYTVGGTVAGLAGTGLTLQNNGTENLTITADGSFAFSTALNDGSVYSVSVQNQPGGLNQTCTMTNAAGSLAGSNVTNVAINCITTNYTVGGFVSGLAGSGLVLQNNAGDDLVITADGNFSFATSLTDGIAYAVTVLTTPNTPTQVCTLSNATGSVAGVNVDNVLVECVSSVYTIGGTVTGLVGSGLVLQNNSGDDLAIGIDGSFTFTSPIEDSTAYSVVALTQPGTPTQSCAINNDSGTLAGSNVTNVAVNCTTSTYTIGGIVTGYTGSGLILQNNAGDDLAIAADGSFSFATALNDSSAYAVSVLTTPTVPTQACNITNASGNLAGSNVSNVTISCTTNVFTVGGTVLGLTGSGLVLQNNGGNELAITADGAFVFSSAVADTGSYAVSVLTQPGIPDQNCNIINNSGDISGANVTNVTLTCSTTNYSIGGTISGLTGSGLILQNNAGDNLPISANGSFVFATALADTSAYAVTVQTPPGSPTQSCAITNASGTLAAANITNVNIACTTTTYTIGGTVTGLAGTGFILQNNGGDNLAIAADGVFTFATALNDSSVYAVSVQSPPGSPNQSCTISNAGGALAGTNVTNVSINCTTDTYTVNGFVSGLAGTGLVLQNNAGDNLAITADGGFSFATALNDTSGYAVSVSTQPGNLSQICSVTNGSGTIAGSDISNVTVSCITSSYTVGGTVTGLAGSGMVLRNNGGDDLPVAADGSFTFASSLIDGNTYAVSVATQPGTPAQICNVTNGSSTLSGANITSVIVSCTTSDFTIGGNISGLVGSGLVLQNNAGDDLAIATNGSFTFATALADSSIYAVSAFTQPGSPNQTCAVTNGGGTLSGSSITNVSINCVTKTYTVGGNVTGLAGSGLLLQNNGGDNLAIAADGSFAFVTALNDVSSYAVSVQTQPGTLNQTCTVTNGSGNLAGSNVTNVAVSCINNNYTIGGIVTGLAGSGLVLQNSGGDDLSIAADGAFNFSTAVADGGAYVVSVLTQPTSLNQTCSVTTGSGNVAGSNVSHVSINCVTNSFTVSGTVTGLAGSGLILENNAGDDLVITADGGFTFSTAVGDGGTYSVAVGTQPSSLSQSCSVTNASGTISSANISNVAVNCVTSSFTVGGTVSGLTGSGLVLQNNLGDNLSIAADGSFAFATPLTDGSIYAVSVLTQPGTPQQACSVSVGGGTVNNTNVTNVLVNCTSDTYTVSGFVSGLAGAGLVLQNNGGDDLAIAADGSFVFSSSVNNGAAYAVSVLTEPSSLNQICTIANASGTIVGANVTDINLVCVTNTYTVGVTVSGLAGTSLILENNGADDLVIAANGSFAFAMALNDGSAYSVTIQGQPSALNQVCSVTNASGSLAGSNITNVAINCVTTTYTVGGAVTGLNGTGLILQNNAGDNLAVAADGSFTFATPVADGSAYVISVLTQPTSLNQVCSVTTGSGLIAGSNVSNVAVSCVSTTYTLGVTVNGLAGSGLTLHQNGGDVLAVAIDGSYTFSTPLADGSGYIVSVDMQPVSPSQTCSVSNASGAIAGSNVTNVIVNCVTDNYAVGGFVTGLAGSGLTLQNNAGDNLVIAANGSFTFSTDVTDATAYAVTVFAQPTGLSQTCSVTNADGTINSADIINVTVSCATDSFTVAATVSGLAGTGLVLENNSGDDLAFAADGTLVFATPILDGSAYSVSVQTQPGTLDQTCAVTNASGNLAGSNIINVAVTCTTDVYTVGGAVTGLAGSGLTLQNNTLDNLLIAADGSFTFVSPVTDGNAYAVAVSAQPGTLNQTCTVTNGSGAVAGGNVVNVDVSCVNNSYTVGGTVTGLVGSGLVLENNNGDDLAIAADGSFTFATALADGNAYVVGVQTQPNTLDQTCTVTNETGALSGSNVTNVTVTCVTDTYTVGGFVTGLVGSGFALQNNAGDDLNVGGDGSFAFSTPIDDGAAYAVTILTSPTVPSQVCTLSNATGNVAGDNVTNVIVNCDIAQFTIGGTVTGLAGGGLVLQKNGGDDLAIGVDGAFVFSLPVDDASTISVSVLTSPSSVSQTCTVTNGTEQVVTGANVTNVAINCTTNTYTVGGIVTGYTGSSGLILKNNAGDNLAIAADGSFNFVTALTDGNAYAVSVSTPPTGPIKACLITNDSGNLAGSNITNVAVTCTTSIFTIGGSVTGYTGSTGLVLQNNGGDDLAIAADGAFIFSTAIADSGSYAVSVLTQPGGVAKNCNIVNNSGVLAGGIVSDVTITCATNLYSIGGTVTGLTGSGLVLQNNVGDNLPISANGSFVFPTALADGSAYAVTVLTPPGTPTQSCAVTAGSGTLASANISNVNIACTTDTFTIGGNVIGLSGAGLILQNNGGNDLAIGVDGAFTFTTPITDGTAYAVSVLTNPSSPSQTCVVTFAGGTLSGSNISNVVVNCGVDTYTVSGFVTGLIGSGLVLQNNAGDNLSTGGGSFTFGTEIPDAGAYAVTVLTQPGLPNQTCAVTSGSGTIASSSITNVIIDCTTVTYTVGGTISGLTGSGLVLENNAGDDLVITANGVFNFATALADGSVYGVVVQTPPSSPTQTCSVTNASGALAGSNVTDVTIICTTDSFTISGNVSGLAGSGLVLQNNLGDDLVIAADGSFTFATSITDGTAYAVSVLGQPGSLNQTCSVATGSGNVSGANVTNVAISCTTTTYTVGGTVSGLAGTGLILENNNGDDLPIAANGSFTFATPLADGGAYSVSIGSQPGSLKQTCLASTNSGNIAGGNVTTVAITCTTNNYAVSGFVSGLAGDGLVLQNNAGDDLVISANGSFTFAAPITDGNTYAVGVLTQPTNLSQICSVSSGGGTISGSSVSNVLINCTSNTFTIGGTVSGLTGSNLSLINNGGDDILIAANGSFTFPAALADGSVYSVAVQNQPETPIQTCSVTNGSSTLSGSNVTNVIVSCNTSDFTVGGTISGLSGSGLVIQNNGIDNLTLSANGSFTFPTALADNSVYSVSVLTQPGSPDQTCSVTSSGGIIAGGNVTSVAITCITTKYTVGGTIIGLDGTGLILENNGGNDLTIAANGSFTFTTSLNDGSAFDVRIQAHPIEKHQTCTVTNGVGNLSGSDVIDIVVSCTTNTYTIGGVVTGLAGTGLVLQNNAGDDLAIAADGNFVFSAPILDDGSYIVSVLTPPTGLNQTCSVTNSSGIADAFNVINVLVNCVNNVYTVGGTVTGLAGSDLHLENNGGDDLEILVNGSFTFTTSVTDGDNYTVTIARQPELLSQTCAVTNDTGTLSGGDVTNVIVTCVTTGFTVGGRLTGLETGESVTLQNNAGDDLVVAGIGNLALTGTASQSSNLSAALTADKAIDGVSSGVESSGTIAHTQGSTATDWWQVDLGSVQPIESLKVWNRDECCLERLGNVYVMVADTPFPADPNDLAGALANADFTFQMPATEVGDPVITVGSVLGRYVRLQKSGVNPGGDAINIAEVEVFSRNEFTFPIPIEDGTAYEVTVSVQNVDHHCTVTNEAGLIAGDNVSNVLVTCVSTVLPGIPVVSLTYSIKELNFSWIAADHATNYHISEDVDGASGYTVVSGEIEGGLSFDRPIPFLPDHLNARYIVTACNVVGCVDSAPVFMANNLLGAIGYFKASNTDSGDLFGQIHLSDDGNTLVVGARGDDSNATGSNGDDSNNSLANSGAAYVYFRNSATNTWSQQAYLKASSPGNADLFGTSISLSDDGNTLAVGATREDSNANGIDGNEADNSAADAGAVYVFTRTGTAWSQQAYIKASNSDAADNFGHWVALNGDGNTLVVSTPNEDSGADGINGNEADNSAATAGAAYVFTRSGTTWTQEAYIKAEVSDGFDRFGHRADLSDDGDTLVVGSTLEDGGVPGVNGNQFDNSAIFSGAVYVYTRSAGVWTQQSYIKPNDLTGVLRLGRGLSISGDGLTLAAGAFGISSNAIGIDGDQTDTSMPQAGGAFVWFYDGTTWVQQAFVKASNPDAVDLFGISLMLSDDGNRLAISSPTEDGGAVGINGNDADNSAADSGSAYLFYRDGGLTGTWSQHAYIKASNTQANDGFESIALSGDGNTMAGCAGGEDSNTTGIGGDQTNNSAGNSGAVYLY